MLHCLGTAADRLFAFLLRPRVRRIRRWAFLVTLPVAGVVAYVRGLEFGLGLMAVYMTVYGSVMFAAWRLGGERGAALLDGLFHPVVRNAIRSELTVFAAPAVAIMRLIRRARPGEFSYARAIRPLRRCVGLVVMLIVILAAASLLQPLWIFWLLILMASYVLLALLGWYSSFVAYPHRLTGSELWIRRGASHQVRVQLEAIAHIERTTGGNLGRTGTRPIVDSGVAHIPVGGLVNIHLRLNEPALLKRPFADASLVTEILFYCDEPHRFTDTLRAALNGIRESATQATMKEIG